MPMIHAETVKAVQQLLHENGIEQRAGERLGDYLARGLHVSSAQAERFLDALHEGRSVEEAQAVARIPGACAGWAAHKDRRNGWCQPGSTPERHFPVAAVARGRPPSATT